MSSKDAESKSKNVVVDDPNQLSDVLKGDLKDRRYGIRIDDDVEIVVIAGNDLMTVRGKLLSMKDDIEIIAEDGNYQQIMSDWVVSIKLLKHNRPPPDRDQELARKQPVKQKPKKISVDHAYS